MPMERERRAPAVSGRFERPVPAAASPTQILSGGNRNPRPARFSTTVAGHNVTQIGAASNVHFNFCTYAASPMGFEDD